MDERSKKKIDYDIKKLEARGNENLVDCTGGVNVESCRHLALPISLSLAGCRSLDVGRTPGTAGHRPRSIRLSILFFSDGPEEHYEAFLVNGEDLHLCVSKVEKLSFDRPDDHRRDRPTKSSYSQTLPGHSLHIYRRRSVLGKFSILWLSVADRHPEGIMLATWKDPQVEIGRSTSFPVPS